MRSSIFSTRVTRAALFVLLTSASSLALSASPAMAQISAPDLQGVQTAVSNALAGVTVPTGASQAQIDALYASAIASVMESLVSQYPSDNPTSLAEAVMTAIGARASETAIGDGLATAALYEGSTAGTEIADALAGAGTATEISAFQATALASNTDLGKTLAQNAGSTGQVGQGGGTGGGGGVVTIGGGLGGGGGGGGGCTNPSCT